MTDYLDIIALRLRHDFYADGDCADFEVEPLGAARRYFASRRLIVRAERAGFRLFAPVRGGKLVAPLDGAPALLFGLRPLSGDLGLYTDFAEDRPAHKSTWLAGPQPDRLWFDRLPSYIFSHAPGATALAELAVYDFLDFIPIVLETDALQVTVTLKNQADAVVARADFPTAVPADGSAHRRLETSLDVRTIGEALYTLETSLAGQPPVPVLVRAALDERYKRLVLIRVADQELMTAAEEPQPVRTYVAQFRTLAREWVYRLALTAKNIDKAYKIVHVPQNGDAVIAFADPVPGPVEDGERKLVIRSAGTVGFRERPRKGIKLKQVVTVAGTGGNPPTVTESEVIAHLPNPSPRQANADIFVRV